jgi:hypothetical protein
VKFSGNAVRFLDAGRRNKVGEDYDNHGGCETWWINENMA